MSLSAILLAYVAVDVLVLGMCAASAHADRAARVQALRRRVRAVR